MEFKFIYYDAMWLGIGVCLFHSALFAGMTLGVFGMSRLKLEVLAETNDAKALKILSLRKDANLLLASLLWGNVGANVLLTLLTESILTGVGAFLFSTVVITFLGEIFPQAYLSRHVMRAGAVFVPLIKLYQVLLYPIAKPTAMLLDAWIGKEGIIYFQESEMKVLLRKHLQSSNTNIDRIEGLGAINFLSLDDVRVESEGETIDPLSVISLPVKNGRPVFPDISKDPRDPFLQEVRLAKKKWVILTDSLHNPVAVLDADPFLNDSLFNEDLPDPWNYCHVPLVVTKDGTKLGEILNQLKVESNSIDDDVIDQDVILYWNTEKKIITGSDILGRLLRGIVKRDLPDQTRAPSTKSERRET